MYLRIIVFVDMDVILYFKLDHLLFWVIALFVTRELRLSTEMVSSGIGWLIVSILTFDCVYMSLCMVIYFLMRQSCAISVLAGENGCVGICNMFNFVVFPLIHAHEQNWEKFLVVQYLHAIL